MTTNKEKISSEAKKLTPAHEKKSRAEIIEMKERLEKTNEFKKWKKKKPGFYLVHLFFMSGHEPQLGYYNKKTDKIVTFDMGKEIVISAECDVVKESGEVESLNLEEIKINKSEAMKTAVEFAEQKYNSRMGSKEIIILQSIKEKAAYNITFITNSFKMINVKIDASNNQIISDEIHSVMDMA